jgi:hypothetical protein
MCFMIHMVIKWTEIINKKIIQTEQYKTYLSTLVKVQINLKLSYKHYSFVKKSTVA